MSLYELFFRINGKENGNYYNRLYRDYYRGYIEVI